jgi:hypothetical protein
MTVEYQNITIETIDQAVFDWFDVTVDTHVEFPNGERRKVPVSFSAGERAVTSRQKKAIRDNNGVLILPLINITRTSIEPNPNMEALGVETPTLQISKQISGETNTLRNLMKDRIGAFSTPKEPIVYEVTTIPFPDRSIMVYRLKIQTQYITQMNAILEKIFNQLDLQKSFVATFDPRRHPPIGEPFEEREELKSGYVCGFFSDVINDSGNLTEFTDQERIVLYETVFRVPATLQLDPEGEKPAVQREYTSYKVDFGGERVCFVRSKEELDKYIELFEGKRR